MNVDNPLALYRQMVKRVLDEMLSTRIENESAEHAAILIDELIRRAKNCVDIYCRSFAADVWGRSDILDAVRHAMEHNVRFRILTQHQPEMSETFRELKQCPKVEYRIFTDEEIDVNFLIADGKSFRFEPDSGQRHGFAYAKSELSATLEAVFNRMWNLSRDGDGDGRRV